MVTINMTFGNYMYATFVDRNENAYMAMYLHYSNLSLEEAGKKIKEFDDKLSARYSTTLDNHLF